MDQETQYDTPAGNPLWHRISLAFGAHDVSIADKQAYREALETIPDNQLDDLTWETLPQAAREVIERCEALPRTSWEDPTEVPEDTSYMD